MQLSINAKKGDKVNIRISGGKAWITGNNTAPPTDDSSVKEVLKTIENFMEGEAQDYDTPQYFWFNDEGTPDVPTGAYVTEVPQDEYKETPTRGSILVRSAGVFIRNAVQTLAQFLGSGMTLFSSAGHKLAEFLSSGIALYDGTGNLDENKIAEFTPSEIKLGKETAKINLCDGKGVVETVERAFPAITTHILQISSSGEADRFGRYYAELNLVTNGSIDAPAEDRVYISLCGIYQEGASGQSSSNEIILNAIGSLNAKTGLTELYMEEGQFYFDANHDGGSPSHGQVNFYNVYEFRINGALLMDRHGHVFNAYEDSDGNVIVDTYLKGTTTSNRVLIGDGTKTVKSLATGVTVTLTKRQLIYLFASARVSGLGLSASDSETRPEVICYESENARRTPTFVVPTGTYYIYIKASTANSLRNLFAYGVNMS